MVHLVGYQILCRASVDTYSPFTAHMSLAVQDDDKKAELLVVKKYFKYIKLIQIQNAGIHAP